MDSMDEDEPQHAESWLSGLTLSKAPFHSRGLGFKPRRRPAKTVTFLRLWAQRGDAVQHHRVIGKY